MPATAGAGPATVPRDGGGVEEDAPEQEEAAEGQRGEREGKRIAHKEPAGQEAIKARRHGDQEKRKSAGTRESILREQKCRCALQHTQTEKKLLTPTREQTGSEVCTSQGHEGQTWKLSSQEQHKHRDQWRLSPAVCGCGETHRYFLTRFIPAFSRRLINHHSNPQSYLRPAFSF